MLLNKEANWGVSAPRYFFGDKHWNEPLKWNRAAMKAGVRRRVFCASMADVFEDRRDLIEPRARLWHLIRATPWLDWQLLTKRPENLARMVPWMSVSDAEPWPNVWLGTTVEDQRRAEERIPELLKVPAVVRFLSCEPLLGPVDLTRVKWPNKGEHSVDVLRFGYWDDHYGFVNHSDMYQDFFKPIDWVIVGGESGRGARPFVVDWAYSIIAHCKHAAVACFIKQLGARPRGLCSWRHHDTCPPRWIDEHGTFVEVSKQAARDLCHAVDDAWWPCAPKFIDTKHGGDWDEWPETLRVRQFPQAI